MKSEYEDPTAVNSAVVCGTLWVHQTQTQKPTITSITSINVTFGVCAAQFDEDSHLSVKQLKYFIHHS